MDRKKMDSNREPEAPAMTSSPKTSIPAPYIAPRILTIWHMHLGTKNDPKATSHLDALLRTCVSANEI